MFQKYGILESASDTINAAISSASDEIIEEKVNAFKILVELLLDQFEYGQLYDLKGYYPKISKASMLGYDLDEKIEGHKAEHVDEYYAHLYGKAIYCMQNGKFKDAAKLIKAAKRVKNTFDVRCAEISLALLEFKYLKSRELIDTLIKDQGQYAGTEGIAESIEHFEVQYRELIGTISSMLKFYAINCNTDAGLK